MPKICYVPKNFSPERLAIISQANRICVEYARAGYDLTLRQLYYRFVAGDLFPDAWVSKTTGSKNCDENYTRLGDLISDARLAGLIDWNHIVDRTRNLRGIRHFDHPADALEEAALLFAMDKWKDQKHYVEIWVEKDALVGIVGQTASRWDCPYFSCRGYTSQSEMWAASQRLLAVKKSGRQPHIIHLGDHDPSGMDMSRDIFDRLKLFCGDKVHILRAALNMAQVQRFSPPPNPAKVTDSRYESYRAKYGDYSWELDALDPRTLADIITRAIHTFLDQDLYQAAKDKEGRAKKLLGTIRSRWADVVRYLQANPAR